MSEFFFYYSKKKIIRQGYGSHITDDITYGFLTEISNVCPPRVYEEENPDEIIYYVEMPGVKHKQDINAILDEEVLKVKAKPEKLEYFGHSKIDRIKEYRIALKLPEGIRPEDIKIKFLEDKGVLIIRVKKRKKSREIPIE